MCIFVAIALKVSFSLKFRSILDLNLSLFMDEDSFNVFNKPSLFPGSNSKQQLPLLVKDLLVGIFDTIGIQPHAIASMSEKDPPS